MIPLNLTLDQDRRDDHARYYVPARPTNDADRWHIGNRTYRVDYLAIPRAGGEPLVALERQTLKGRDYLSPTGRRVLPLSELHTLADDDTALRYVEQARDALVRVTLDEQRAATEDTTADQVLSRYSGAAKITLTAVGVRKLAERTGETVGQVEQAARRQGMAVEPQPETWTAPTIPVDEDVPMLDDLDAPEGTPTHPQPCVQGCGRRTRDLSGVCGPCRALDATMREGMAQWPEHEAEPSGRKIVPTACMVCGQEVEPSPLVPAGEEPLWQHVDPSARQDVGRPESFERPGSVYDGVLGYDPHTHAAVTETSRPAGGMSAWPLVQLNLPSAPARLRELASERRRQADDRFGPARGAVLGQAATLDDAANTLEQEGHR